MSSPYIKALVSPTSPLMDSLSAIPSRLSDVEDPPIDQIPYAVNRRPSLEGTISDVKDLKEEPGTRRQSISTIAVHHINEKTDEEESFLVDWDGPEDMENPKNWSNSQRWYITGLTGALVFNATFASSSPSGIIPQMKNTLAFQRRGPLLWGPLSETYGRRPIFIISFFMSTLFQMACALSKNTASMLIFRFLGGCFAASPLANSGAVMADVWDARIRGKALTVFALGPFAGPALGPAVGGFIGDSGASWRWLFWTITIFSAVVLILVILTLPETYAPTILKRKAKQRRLETGNDKWHAPLESVSVPLTERLSEIIGKPFKLFFQEPMLFAITMYLAFAYGCLYLLFEAYPIVFQEGHHFKAGIAGLMFLPLLVGSAIGCLMTLVYYDPQYNALCDQYAPNPVPPEARLPSCIVGGVFLVISFFWFGWTSYPSISYWSPMIAGGAFGLGMQLIFLSLINYIVDVYLSVAASALAVTVIVRSVFGAGFPLFARQMYNKLNPRWASTLLGFITLLLVPIPILFVRYGPYLRSKSKNMPAASRDTVVLPSRKTLPKELEV
ncbi:hypothetical protein BS47DRAFT_1357256 [Hydnum rufescens UP504]|uniref:Major facilitator superfamily (MFS) profile domain-containing protein n=1 Tax=Hydnum rufescens UP504 TaxID=1448309 RepID=A0A9P6BBQ1_9AGAM|nr:hypothetical protein BS47DRAFT_1357256 [Hydnum rufescens UP504]